MSGLGEEGWPRRVASTATRGNDKKTGPVSTRRGCDANLAALTQAQPLVDGCGTTRDVGLVEEARARPFTGGAAPPSQTSAVGAGASRRGPGAHDSAWPS